MGQYVEFRGISKAFPGVQALRDVSFRIDGGRVTALVGENGAGKSTLLKILSGDLAPDEGVLIIDGAEKKFSHPNEAIKTGISVIYQERQLIPALSVMENIFLDDLPCNRVGILRVREIRRQAREIIESFGLRIDPDAPVARLPVAYQQMVEIMKAYRRDSRVIAFDEPTAPLTDAEIDILFKLIGRLRDEGKVVLYVSHRMAEIFRITDDIAVMKDGQLVETRETARTDERALISAMVGRDVGDTYAKLSRNDRIGDVLLEVNGLETEKVHNVSFTLRRGEVLGFAGLVGAGRTEVMRALFGVDDVIAGEIRLEGEPADFTSPRRAIDAGLALCPEDRKEQGLILPRSIAENISAPVLKKVSKGVFIDTDAERRLADASVEKYSIKTPTVSKITYELSGGNQQKVILARWTSEMMTTKVLILDEPTKGIDVGTKAEVYQMVCDYAKEGKGVIFISSELTEVLSLCDRIIVMRDGYVSGELTREEATEERVLALAMTDVGGES
ncbi:MAG: sugar ABC transporter ATP-binding protein [Oscillospiraceae bacterium]|nr:sugar ABC transporter ATP-binding protein [Oscillospiraceae bacterium]